MKIASVNPIQYNNSLRSNTDAKVCYNNTPKIPQDSFVKSASYQTSQVSFRGNGAIIKSIKTQPELPSVFTEFVNKKFNYDYFDKAKKLDGKFFFPIPQCSSHHNPLVFKIKSMDYEEVQTVKKMMQETIMEDGAMINKWTADEIVMLAPVRTKYPNSFDFIEGVKDAEGKRRFNVDDQKPWDSAPRDYFIKLVKEHAEVPAIVENIINNTNTNKAKDILDISKVARKFEEQVDYIIKNHKKIPISDYEDLAEVLKKHPEDAKKLMEGERKITDSRFIELYAEAKPQTKTDLDELINQKGRNKDGNVEYIWDMYTLKDFAKVENPKKLANIIQNFVNKEDSSTVSGLKHVLIYRYSKDPKYIQKLANLRNDLSLEDFVDIIRLKNPKATLKVAKLKDQYGNFRFKNAKEISIVSNAIDECPEEMDKFLSKKIDGIYWFDSKINLINPDNIKNSVKGLYKLSEKYSDSQISQLQKFVMQNGGTKRGYNWANIAEFSDAYFENPIKIGELAEKNVYYDYDVYVNKPTRKLTGDEMGILAEAYLYFDSYINTLFNREHLNVEVISGIVRAFEKSIQA